MNKRRLFIVYNQAVAKARKLPGGDKVVQRLRLALGILQHHDYYQAEKSLYNPTKTSCGCKDWEFRNAAKRGYTGHCKHMIAEVLLERAQALTWVQANFLPVDNPVEENGMFMGYPVFEILQKGFTFNSRRLDVYNRYCRVLANKL